MGSNFHKSPILNYRSGGALYTVPFVANLFVRSVQVGLLQSTGFVPLQYGLAVD